MNFLTKYFKRPPLTAVNAETFDEAQFQLTQHLAAQEYHQAMIEMYERRIARLGHQGRVESLAMCKHQ